jgi:hypothetical protein
MKKWIPNPNYEKATHRVVFVGSWFPAGSCCKCGALTNRVIGYDGEWREYECEECCSNEP